MGVSWAIQVMRGLLCTLTCVNRPQLANAYRYRKKTECSKGLRDAEEFLRSVGGIVSSFITELSFTQNKPEDLAPPLFSS